MRCCSLCRRFHLGVRRIEPPKADILHRGVGKDHRLLRHQRHGCAQVCLCDFVDGHTVEQNAPGIGVVKPKQHLNDRRLARAGWAHDRDAFARFYR